ncbi:MAG: hypothetical protein AAF514_20790, partial [Verrucomicrobiota bacterium]
MNLTFGMFDAGNNWFWAVDNITVRTKGLLFAENFDQLPLKDSVDEEVASENVWTDEAPLGWSVDRSDVAGIDNPNEGVTEWQGWGFADRDWWVNTAGDQRRSEFTKASGVVAIADPDEWDDKGDPEALGSFNSFLSAGPIPLAGVDAGAATLTFDSSWRPENDQKAIIQASFDGGEAVEILRWTSDAADPNFKDDSSTNDSISVPIQNPEGARSVVITFGMIEARNNWFWAVDNVALLGSASPVYPSGLVVTADRFAQTVTLEWSPASNVVGTIQVIRDGEVIAELPVDATMYVDEAPPGSDGEGAISYIYGIQIVGAGIDEEAISKEVVYSSGAATRTLFEENFDSVVLGPSVDEGAAEDMVWTADAPAGWTVDNSRMPMDADELIGTTEWRGWTFADPLFWAAVDDQRRSEFTKAMGAAAIADPDEWDDNGNPASVGNFESYLTSPDFEVRAEAGTSITVVFDSSWRPEGNQTGNLTVSVDGGDSIAVLRHDTATTQDNETNETKVLQVPVPAGANNMNLTFGMFDAGNNWFWAIDNVLVTTEAVPICPSALTSTTDVDAGTVQLSWVPGRNLENARVRVLRNGEMIAELPFDADSYTDIVTNPNPNEGLILEYTVEVIDSPNECPTLSRTIVFSQGTVTKVAQWDFEGTGLTVGNSVSERFPGTLVDLDEDSRVQTDFLGNGLQFEVDGYVDFGTSP